MLDKEEKKMMRELKNRLLLNRYTRFDYRLLLLRKEYGLNYGQIILLAGLIQMSKKKNPVKFDDEYITWCFDITQRTYEDWLRVLKDTKLIDYEFIKGRRKKNREITVNRDEINMIIKRLDMEENLDREEDKDLIEWYENYGNEISLY